MPVIEGRCPYNELAQAFWDAMIGNGWEKIMSAEADGVLKKNVNGADVFMKFGAITGNTRLVQIGPLEDYTRGSTGVTATFEKTVPGDNETAAVYELTINTPCTTAGTFNIDISDGELEKSFKVPVALNAAVNTIATNVSNALKADGDLDAAYDITVDAAIVTITKKEEGDVSIDCLFNQGTNGVKGTMTNNAAQSFYFATTNINTAFPVDYKFYIYDDHVIIGLEGDKAVTGAINSVYYTGKPVFFGTPEIDNSAAFAAASNAETAVIKPLKNRTGAVDQPSYNSYAAIPPTNPGQGDLHYMAPIVVGDANDGIRGEIQHICAMPTHNVVHGDTITVGSAVYDVYVCGGTGTSTLAGTRVLGVFSHNN